MPHSPFPRRTPPLWSNARQISATAVLGVVCALLIVVPAQAAQLQATPSNFSSVFAGAQGGDTIHLAPGSYGEFRGAAKSSMVTVVADPGVAASMSASFDGAAFIRVQNLTVTSADIARSHDIQFIGNRFTGSVRIDTRDNNDERILLDRNTHDGINVCSSCYEGRITVVGSDNTAPNGVKITNSHFSGGDSDGIQITGNAYGTQIGPGNVFEKIVMIDATHTDAIQLYYSRHTQIVGNFLYGNETGIMAADGADHEVIRDNVFTTAGYPWPIVLGADNGSTIEHNTMPDGACSWSMRCGDLRIWGGNQGVASRGTIVRDNILGALSLEDGSKLAAEDHNLIAESAPSATDIKGKPTFIGGVLPLAWAGFALAPGSLGENTASDDTDRGAAISGASPDPSPAPSPSPSPTPSPTPTPTPTDEPARALWTAPSDVHVGTPVTLDATASTGTAPLTCTWSFENADGSTVWETASGCKIRKTFLIADTKYIKLTVRDADGDTSVNRQSFPVSAA